MQIVYWFTTSLFFAADDVFSTNDATEVRYKCRIDSQWLVAEKATEDGDLFSPLLGRSVIKRQVRTPR